MMITTEFSGNFVFNCYCACVWDVLCLEKRTNGIAILFFFSTKTKHNKIKWDETKCGKSFVVAMWCDWNTIMFSILVSNHWLCMFRVMCLRKIQSMFNTKIHLYSMYASIVMFLSSQSVGKHDRNQYVSVCVIWTWKKYEQREFSISHVTVVVIARC